MTAVLRVVEQFEGQRRKEGDAQYLHGRVTELLADLIDVFCVGFGLPENFERGQALQAVEEMRRQAAEGFVLAVGNDLLHLCRSRS